MAETGDDPDDKILKLVLGGDAEPGGDEPALDDDPVNALGPSDAPDPNVDPRVIEECAALDHSDLDNAQRLRRHFGDDLLVVERAQNESGDWLCWEGRYWSMDDGAAGAKKLAHKVGGRIALEADHLRHTPEENVAIRRAGAFSGDDESDDAKTARERAKKAKAALAARKTARWKFAVTSKNSARLKNMLTEAAPYFRRPSASFNADPFLLTTETHTLRFVKERDDECPDPDVERFKWRIAAKAGHAKSDYATGLTPCAYAPETVSKKWLAFLDRCMPDIDLRRTVQQYCGTSILGVLPQKVMFHHGHGANGKSVFLSTIGSVIGSSYGVGLPKETIMGQGERGAGQASPDLVRLAFKRFVRIDELKEGEALREDLIKRLVGGDEQVVRDLYKGYFTFTNVATPHMSGNGFPRIDGTDAGIWRRVLVAHWSVTIPAEERRDFAEMVADLLSEREGILNWMIEGALDFLNNGLFIAPAAIAATESYREDMDPIGRFIADCVETAPGEKVQARVMYEAYVSWCKANAQAARFEQRFGKEMGKRFTRGKNNVMVYLDCRLHDVPARPDEHAPPPREEDYG